MARKASLPALRRDIDRIDGALLRLLNERARVVLRVAEQKARTNSTVYAAGREKNVLTRIAALNDGPLPDRLVRGIFREIISASRSLQSPLKVAYLGPEATFAHLAARQLFGAATEYLPAGTIADVFHEVETGRAGLGVVPVENSTEGMVAHTLDLLAESPLRICAEVSLPIQHCLMARPGTRMSALKRVAAHPQAIAQCRQWLATNLPKIHTSTESSNARAAERARGERGMAAIAAEAAADVYGLDILARGVQDDPGNLTRFLVLSQRDAAQPSGDDKTSLLFSARNEVGVLSRMLKPFADYGVDLIKIESRPLRGQPWEYVFFIDCKGHRKTRRVQQALAEVGKKALRLKVLGSYPVAAAPNGGKA